MVFKKCSKFHRCSLRGFNLIETVCELFDNLSYVHLSTAYIYMRITFYHHVTWQYDSTSILHHNEPMNSVYIFKRLAYNANRWMSWVQINDATGCFVKAIPMGQNIVLDKSYTNNSHRYQFKNIASGSIVKLDFRSSESTRNKNNKLLKYRISIVWIIHTCTLYFEFHIHAIS